MELIIGLIICLFIFGAPILVILSYCLKEPSFVLLLLLAAAIIWLFCIFPGFLKMVYFLIGAAAVLSMVFVLVYGLLIFPAIKLYEFLRGE